MPPEKDLIEQLSSAAALMSSKDYRGAADVLSRAYKDSFAAPETGFVMAELLRQNNSTTKRP